MAATFCKVQLLGNVGKDPEIKTSQGGMQIASFSIATQKKVKQEYSTQWFNCVAFGKLSEIIQKYVVKGSKIYVDGTIDFSQYQKDGEIKYVTKIIVNEISLLSGSIDEKSNETDKLDYGSENSTSSSNYREKNINDEIPF